MENAEVRSQNAEVKTKERGAFLLQSDFILLTSFWHHLSVQNLSLKYFSPESQRMVTMTASSSFFHGSSRAIFKHPTTAAAEETPTNRPAVRESCRAMA